MRKPRITITLSDPLVRLAESYRERHGFGSVAEVVEYALAELMARELELAYAAAASEIDPAWDATLMDGLDEGGVF